MSAAEQAKPIDREALRIEDAARKIHVEIFHHLQMLGFRADSEARAPLWETMPEFYQEKVRRYARVAFEEFRKGAPHGTHGS